MNAKDAIKMNLEMSQMVSLGYLEDLTDEQLMMRPHSGCNHINWQIGHLVASENQLGNGVKPGGMPDLPEGMADKYTKETTSSDDPADFCTKEELMAAYQAQRAATLANLDATDDAELGAESPEELRGYAPTVASVYNLQGSHWMMHAGQWVIVRRQLGKPPIF